MNPNSLPQTPVRVSVILFAILLAAPALWGVMGPRSMQGQGENRKLAVLPPVPKRFDELPRYTRRMDRYANDHFGLRDWLVRLSSSLNKAGGRSNFANVVIGKDDWLFFAGDNAIETARGRSVLSNSELGSFADGIERISRRLAAEGTGFVVAIVPGKASVYPEHLPWWAREPSAAPRSTELLQNEFDTRGVRYLDLTARLRQAKSDTPRLYQLGDTHWDAKTAYLVYTWLCEMLGVAAVSDSQFSISRESRLGDLQKLLNLPAAQAGQEWTLHKSRTGKTVVLEDEPRRWARTRINTNARAPSPKTVMLLRDSFGNDVYPLLQSTFQATITTHYKKGEFPWEMIEEHQPDWVVYMAVERFVGPDLLPDVSVQDR